MVAPPSLVTLPPKSTVVAATLVAVGEVTVGATELVVVPLAVELNNVSILSPLRALTWKV